MTQERFLKLLADPALLASISYEELKTLALAYPYAHNLRYLLALKAKLEDRPDAARTLATAAAYSLDRTRLFLLYAPKILAPQRVQEELHTEVLELKPIDIVQKELGALTPVKRADETTAAPQQAVAPPPPPTAPEIVAPVAVNDKPPATQELPLPPKVKRQPFSSWYGQFNLPVLEIPAPPPTFVVATPVDEMLPASTPSLPPLPVEPLPHTPEPETAYQPIAPPETEEQSIKPAHKEMSAQALAERSITENKELVSETLARLLAKQGHRDKAIAMYERLYLVFPEKSAYFAAEIEKLKK